MVNEVDFDSIDRDWEVDMGRCELGSIIQYSGSSLKGNWLPIGSRPVWSAIFAVTLLIGIIGGGAALGHEISGDQPSCFSVWHDEWRWARFGAEDGLPSTLVTMIRQGPDGTMWVGTGSGLTFFDEYGFVSLGESEGISRQRIGSLAVDDQGVVFVLVGDRVFRGGKSGFDEIHIESAGERLRGVSLALHPSGSGAVVIAEGRESGHRGLWQLEGRSITEVPLPAGTGIADDHPSQGHLMSAPSGMILVRMQMGYWVWRGEEWAPFRLGGSQVRDKMRAAGSGIYRLILGGNARGLDDVWTWSGDAEPQPAEFKSAEQVQSIAVWPDGQLLLVYGSGAVRTRVGDTWLLEHQAPRFVQSATELLVDRSCNLWVGTDHGLYMLRCSDPLWRYWSHPFGDQRKWVNAIVPAGDGGVWIGTNGGVAHCDSGDHVSWLPGHDRIAAVTALAEDVDGTLWAGSGQSFGGVYRFRDGRWHRVVTDTSIDDTRIHAMQKDRKGRIWILGLDHREQDDPEGMYTGPGGVFILEDGEIVPWPEWDGSFSSRVYSFLEGADGSYWFGTLAGLRHWKDGVWRDFGDPSGSDVFKIACLAEGPDGRVWFGTHMGQLGWVDSSDAMTFESIPDRLGVSQIWGMAFDAEGGLWLTTANGLLRRVDGAWFRLGCEAGVMHLRLWPILIQEDSVYLGTAGKGFAALRGLNSHNAPPRVSVELKVSDDDVLIRWQPHALMGRVPPSLIPTRIQLDDQPWSDWSVSRDVLFTEQPVGPHTVKVEAFDLLAGSSVGVQSVGFVIGQPRPARTQLALLIAGSVLLVVLMYLMFRRRRRALDRELSLHRARLQSILDNTTAVIYVKDLQGRYVLTNRRFDELFHKKPGEMVGRRDEDWLPPDVAEHVKANDREVEAAGSPLKFEEEVPNDGQLRRYISLKFPLRGEANQVNAICGISTDITDMHQQAEALVKARDEAERANRAKTVFLANVSHEIRTPITAVLSAAEMLEEAAQEGESLSRYLSILMRNAEHLGALVNDLLDLSRTEADSLKVNIEPHSLSAILDGLSAMCDPLRNRSDSHLEFVVDTPLPGKLVTDATRLRQAMYNLIDNAMKYTEKGQVWARFRCDPTERPLMLELIVEDTGHGISPKDLERIFEPFTQLGEGAGDVMRGIGVGLPLARNIARQLGGTITAEPRMGGGSLFRLRVPVGRVEVEQWLSPEEVFVQDRSGPTSNEFGEILRGRVLLAEDYEDTRETIRAALERQGVEVVAVVDGEKALAAVAEGDFDLILMDDRMPGLTGREAVGRMRERGCLTTIIAITATTEEADRRDLLDAGFDDLWPKPIKIREILSRVGDYLASGDSATEAESSETSTSGALFDRLRRSFAGGLQSRIDALVDCVEKKNAAQARELLHQLVGAAGIHGYDELSQEAARLLAEVKRNPAHFDRTSVAALERLAIAVIESVDQPGMAEPKL